MANSNAPTRYELGKFLKTAVLSVLAAILLSRLCYMLYSATYYNTAVSDSLFNLIYYLCGTVFSAWRGIAFGLISYIVINAFCGNIKGIKVSSWVIAAMFIAMLLLTH